MAESIRVSWPPCPACKAGQIVLFTSVVRCAECLGTGFILSDERLSMPLGDFDLAFRTRRFLHRQQILTLGQVFCLAFTKTPEDVSVDNTVVADLERILLESHLPTGYWRANR